jgi:hypothetical protein
VYPPGNEWICINTDGAFKLESNGVGCGGLLRNSLGKWIGLFKSRGVTKAYMAESLD